MERLRRPWAPLSDQEQAIDRVTERRGRGRPRKGLVKSRVSLDPLQLRTLQRIAEKRAGEKGPDAKADASEVLRDAIDAAFLFAQMPDLLVALKSRKDLATHGRATVLASWALELAACASEYIEDELDPMYRALDRAQEAASSSGLVDAALVQLRRARKPRRKR